MKKNVRRVENEDFKEQKKCLSRKLAQGMIIDPSKKGYFSRRKKSKIEIYYYFFPLCENKTCCQSIHKILPKDKFEIHEICGGKKQ